MNVDAIKIIGYDIICVLLENILLWLLCIKK